MDAQTLGLIRELDAQTLGLIRELMRKQAQEAALFTQLVCSSLPGDSLWKPSSQVNLRNAFENGPWAITIANERHGLETALWHMKGGAWQMCKCETLGYDDYMIRRHRDFKDIAHHMTQMSAILADPEKSKAAEEEASA